jgi:hypothetical protein
VAVISGALLGRVFQSSSFGQISRTISRASRVTAAVAAAAAAGGEGGGSGTHEICHGGPMVESAR